MIFEGIPFFDLDGAEFLTTEQLLFLGGASGGKAVEDTATGNPLTFVTDLAKPLKSLIANFLPIQASGTPSPSNILPITGWDAVNAYASGINIITDGFTNGVLDLNTGVKSTNPNYITSEYIPVVPLKSYYFKCPTVVSSELDICYYDKDKHYIGYADADGYVSCNAPGRSRKTPAGCYYVRIDARNAQYNNDICINYPASNTGYIPAVGITEKGVSFPAVGKNLFNTDAVYSDTSKFTINGNAVTGTASSFANTKLYIPSELVGKKLTFSAKITTGADTTYLRSRANVGGTAINGNSIMSGSTGLSYVTFTPTSEYDYVYFGFGSGQNGVNVISEIQLEVGESATTFEPFTNTVFGGYVDLVTGEVWAAYEGIESTWNQGTNPSVGSSFTRKTFAFTHSVKGVSDGYYSSKCNCAALDWSVSGNTHYYIDESKAYLWLPNETDSDFSVQFVSKLKNPILITTLTPQQINAIKGNNTVWSDANGDCSVTFLKKG